MAPVQPAHAAKPPHANGGGYSTFARIASRLCGRPATFALAFAVVIVWLLTGPLFDFSDTWQLVINTGTTIVTFLMVFLIHNAQSRDTEAIQLKLDELIRATQGAHNVLLDVEELNEEALEKLHRQYVHIAEQARDEGEPEIAPTSEEGAGAASARQPAS